MAVGDTMDGDEILLLHPAEKVYRHHLDPYRVRAVMPKTP